MANVIEVGADLYDLVSRTVGAPGETEFIILRRVPKINGGTNATSLGTGGGSGSPEHRPFESRLDQSSLAKFLSGGGAAARRATDTYLRILAFVQSERKDDFEKLLDIRGTRRAYFGRSPEEITAHGQNTHPQRIPGTDYWALTNASTDHKRAILGMALRRLGYDEADVRAACSAVL